MTETKPRVKNRLVDLACYTALVVAAITVFVQSILSLVKINPDSVFMLVLDIIFRISVLIAIASGAYKFSKNTRSIVFKIIFYLAIIIYIVAIVMDCFK